ncbi:GNAT family N-acetyltransferase [Streptomyces sp. ATCC 21386]|uniref:GNAT family N-acetyltransferase n=1 Tax=Streptomyces sp. ATCC 21386 TaxID=2699428 RepID=UPI0027E44C7C|nr:GNAT family N-acetyltransferase [Streptomyces sp. ATCC 21386]
MTLTDAPAVRRIYSAASVRYLPRAPLTAENAASWVTDRIAESRATPRMLYCFGIEHTDDLVGVIKLRPARTSAALSYILRDDAWGHGYATAAAALVLDFASTTLDLASVDAKHHPDNHASGRVLIKSGFTCTGRSAEAITYIRNLAPRTRSAVHVRERLSDGATAARS